MSALFKGGGHVSCLLLSKDMAERDRDYQGRLKLDPLPEVAGSD